MQTVLVTGATGFVGGHAARRLAESYRVRGLVRSLERASSLVEKQVELQQGDLLDPFSLERAVCRADVVVHAATDTVLADGRTAWAVSVEGTRHLYDAARRAGVKRFVFISSAVVYMGTPGATDEEALPAPSGDRYGDGKIAAEQILLNGAKSGGPEVAILRPPSVYGPGSTRWTQAFWTNAKAGRLMLPAGGTFPFPYIYIENLVDAIEAAVRAERVNGAYNLFDGAIPYAQFVQPFLDAAGRPARTIPYGALLVAAAGSALFGRLTGRYMPLTLRSLKAMNRKGGSPYSREKARTDLSWEPRIDLAEGMRRSLEWCREIG